MPKHTIGVDVGGTNIKFGLINPSGKIIARTRLSTARFASNKKSLINAIVDTIKHFIDENRLTRHNIKGIGFGLPGLVDPFKGFILILPNISGWKNVPFQSILEKELKIPVFLENDVNMIALGEWYKGAGRGYRNLVCMTLGTGVGGGLILNNRLYRGEGFAAGEIGHLPLNEKGPKCNCGGQGCFERYVGNKILLHSAIKLFKDKTMTLEKVYALADKKNKKALRFYDEMATHIGNGLIGIVNVLNPRLIIIGGGVSNNYKFIYKKITRVLLARAMPVQARMVKIVRAKLGDDAGILGAKVLIDHAKK